MQFTDLKAQYTALKADIDARIQRVLDHGQYIICLLYTSPSPRD